MPTTFENLPVGAKFSRATDTSFELVYVKLDPITAYAWGVPEHTEPFSSNEKVLKC